MLHNLQYPFAHLITMLVRRLVGLHHVSRYSSLFTCLSPWRRRAQNLPCKSCSQQRHHIKTFCSLNITLILRQYRSFCTRDGGGGGGETPLKSQRIIDSLRLNGLRCCQPSSLVARKMSACSLCHDKQLSYSPCTVALSAN